MCVICTVLYVYYVCIMYVLCVCVAYVCMCCVCDEIFFNKVKINENFDVQICV